MGRWDTAHVPACNAPQKPRHPELDDLPSLPADFEETFMEAAERLKCMANEIKEELSKKAMRHFGGDRAIADDGRSGANEPQRAPEKQRVTSEVFIPAHRAGLVIGHHGETLKRIEKVSQCKVQFDQAYGGQDSDRGDRKIIITGFAEDVEEAKKLIREKVEEPGSRFPTVTMMIPQSRVGVVIGKGGETIRELQEKSGAKITVQPEHQVEAYATERAIMVTGDDESIRRARDFIQEIVSGQGRADRMSGRGAGPTTTIQIPETSVGAVIGKRADNLKQMQSITGCRIYVEPQASSTDRKIRNVHLTGTPEQVAYANQLINDKVMQNEATLSYYNNLETAEAPGVIYQNPNELLSGIPMATAADLSMSAMGGGYDYSQYYYQQYYQQPQDPAATAPAGHAGYPPNPAAGPNPDQQMPYDYAAYMAAYQQMYPFQNPSSANAAPANNYDAQIQQQQPQPPYNYPSYQENK